MNEFKTGDRAMYEGETVTVLTEEVQTYYGGYRAYLVERAGGGAALILASNLTPAPRFTKGDTALFEGYRVKIMGGPYDGAGSMAGKVLYLVEYIDGPDAGKVRTLIGANLLPADDSTFGADRYPRGGLYQDRDGIRWRFTTDAGWSGDLMLGLGKGQRTLERVVMQWGPLIRQR
ncbi:phiSA1p31-related protein [Streptomyces albidoflavus]|uniref:phiSA1p31-related protein n=1 Tax=Streptomyces albidoflavus TaxID=1886 RepID=UPI0033D6CC2D